MSVIQEFTANTPEATFRLQKSVQHLLIRRTCTIAIAVQGLLAAMPERVSAEITHPTRKRAMPADRVPLSHTAVWAQYGRGPIVETCPAPPAGTLLENYIGQSAPVTMTQTLYLNDGGPLEVLADDQFNITISGLIQGAKYTIFAPEQPVLPANAQEYYLYQQALILEGDRQKALSVKGYAGIVIPNNPEAIERLVITYDMDGAGQVKECEYLLPELLDAQGQANPFFSMFEVVSPNVWQEATIFQPSSQADLLVIDFKHIVAIEIHTVLGQRLEYTLVKVANRE